MLTGLRRSETAGAAGPERESGRNSVLDMVRGVAILLVLVQHAGVPNWTHFGWIGVDLFFVLSGFLVTRLLLTEYREYGRADSLRLLIRRGFKVYPAFWAMLLVSLATLLIAGRPPRPLAVLCEVLFLQSYGPGLWVHTWSLAVEEHFYLFLAALFWRPAVPDWLGAKPGRIAAALGAACLTVAFLRVGLAALLRPDLKLLRMGTRARFDALLCGAALAVCFLYRRAALARFLTEHRAAVLSASACMLAAGVLVHDKSPFWYFGLSLLPWAFAALLASALTVEFPAFLTDTSAVRLLAGIGRYSYAIYLWHIPLYQLWLGDFVAGLRIPAAASMALFFLVSLGTGALLGEVIETPFLAARDRWFPSRRAPSPDVARWLPLGPGLRTLPSE